MSEHINACSQGQPFGSPREYQNLANATVPAPANSELDDVFSNQREAIANLEAVINLLISRLDPLLKADFDVEDKKVERRYESRFANFMEDNNKFIASQAKRLSITINRLAV